MDAAGQHLVVMRHQLDVVAVVAADVVEPVAEILPARVVLLEVGEAARQRMAARVDDLRVRQGQVDQADVREVVRHLVDEARRAGLAVDARALEVVLAERRALGRIQRRQRFVVGLRLRGVELRRSSRVIAMISGNSIVPSTASGSRGSARSASSPRAACRR
jgi:hypothetical protein